MRPPTRIERFRFRPAQWAHGPKIVEHEPDGEKWRGFAAAKELSESMIAFDRKAVRDNHSRLAELYARREPDLFMVSANDPKLLAGAVTASA
jgi:hypothetical protein